MLRKRIQIFTGALQDREPLTAHARKTLNPAAPASGVNISNATIINSELSGHKLTSSINQTFSRGFRGFSYSKDRRFSRTIPFRVLVGIALCFLATVCQASQNEDQSSVAGPPAQPQTPKSSQRGPNSGSSEYLDKLLEKRLAELLEGQRNTDGKCNEPPDFQEDFNILILGVRYENLADIIDGYCQSPKEYEEQNVDQNVEMVIRDVIRCDITKMIVVDALRQLGMQRNVNVFTISHQNTENPTCGNCGHTVKRNKLKIITMCPFPNCKAEKKDFKHSLGFRINWHEDLESLNSENSKSNLHRYKFDLVLNDKGIGGIPPELRDSIRGKYLKEGSMVAYHDSKLGKKHLTCNPYALANNYCLEKLANTALKPGEPQDRVDFNAVFTEAKYDDDGYYYMFEPPTGNVSQSVTKTMLEHLAKNHPSPDAINKYIDSIGKYIRSITKYFAAHMEYEIMKYEMEEAWKRINNEMGFF